MISAPSHLIAFAVAPVDLGPGLGRDRSTRGGRQAQSGAARLLLRKIFGAVGLGPGERWELHVDSQGRLEARADGIRISASLSHSRTRVAAALAIPGPIGIDLEFMDPARSTTEMAAVAFGPLEKAAVVRDGAASFYRIWTLREALAKTSGAGFAQVIDGQDRTIDLPRPDLFTYATEIDGYAVAVAADQPSGASPPLVSSPLDDGVLWRAL